MKDEVMAAISWKCMKKAPYIMSAGENEVIFECYCSKLLRKKPANLALGIVPRLTSTFTCITCY